MKNSLKATLLIVLAAVSIVIVAGQHARHPQLSPDDWGKRSAAVDVNDFILADSGLAIFPH